ncbi:MAG: sialate O-acetylesterase [Candidatus Aminicenantes bacterium]|nr:sialate O-acetylesterase [Candidatus Aminicenantes bacterium]
MNTDGRFVYVLILAVLIGVPCARCQQAEKPEYSQYWHQRASHFELLPNESGEIIFLGDSITDGCNWSEMFEDPKIKNRGISGDITQGILDRLDEVVEANPAKVFLMIGINDLAMGKSPEEIVDNTKKIVSTILKLSPETQIYLESLLPVNPDYPQFPNHADKTQEVLAINRVLQRMAQEFDLKYVDLHSKFVVGENKLNPEYTNDGLHLTGAGYRVWKQAVVPYLQ